MAGNGVSVLIGGEAGQGIQTVGLVLAKAAARLGFSVTATQSYQSRIRGGHNTFAVRLTERPAYAGVEQVDVLVCLNRETFELHSFALTERGVAVVDEGEAGGEGVLHVPLRRIGQEAGGALYANSAAAGATWAFLGLPIEGLLQVLTELAGKGEEAARSNEKAARAGYAAASGRALDALGLVPPPADPRRILVSGNEAIALGAVAAGLQAYFAYPMTPATGIMNYLASHGRDFGVVVEQAEDEIAALNMAIGASFAGARAMVGTSGGGFALMVEALSLAGMTETPVVIVDAQRPGPATGLPTRTEQGDLEFVLSAGHGEFPRLVLAPRTAEECFWATVRAFGLAEKYQVPAIILTDQFLADTRRTVERFDLSKVEIERYVLAELTDARAYRRHEVTESGVSPRALPGMTPALVVTDSDEHTEDGHLTEDLSARTRQVDKRLRKGEGLAGEMRGPEVYGAEDAELTLVVWGSTYGPAREVVDRVPAEEWPLRLVSFEDIWPFPVEAAMEVLDKSKRIVVVEGNATGQFERLLFSQTGIEADGHIRRYDGLPFTSGHILRALE